MAFRVRDLNPAIAVNGGLASPDAWDFNQFASQVAATASITITGTETDADTLTVTFTSQQLPGGSYAVQVTTADAESLSVIATAIENAINNDPLLKSLGITATSALAVVTVKWIAGPLGNFASIAFSANGGSEMATISSFSGGAGYVIPQQDYRFAYNGSIIVLKYRQPIQVDYQMLSAMLAAGILIV